MLSHALGTVADKALAHIFRSSGYPSTLEELSYLEGREMAWIEPLPRAFMALGAALGFTTVACLHAMYLKRKN